MQYLVTRAQVCNAVASLRSLSNLSQGKTWFLSYILARRLLAQRPTVYRRGDDECYLFSERSKGWKISLDFLCALSDDEKRDLWILTDNALVHAEWDFKIHPWFVVLAAAPRSITESRQWGKDRNPYVRYMRNWEWHEIFAAFRYCPKLVPSPTKRLGDLVNRIGHQSPKKNCDLDNPGVLVPQEQSQM